ncbi:hypothetical protein FHR92_003110 [Fontibacillus solani]|uniref:N-acetyltransferase domain-containing protein n=1 Tax=Fontibacillus solani TaxID=1572857 RepID=A0A7W3XSK6_9BACL|nr:hypothetical protein [Fontibacillus solani]MBA9086630.1 hypothetical protein [Fontibacillus solani]
MLRARASHCVRDEDYARFTRFYAARCRQFNSEYYLLDALLHLVSTLSETHILLFDDDEGQLIAFFQYKVEDDTAFIDSAMLSEHYRSSRVFYEGFRDVARHILAEHKNIETVQFYALADNLYLTRLYSKFADKTGVRKGGFGLENIFVVKKEQLLKYLKID